MVSEDKEVEVGRWGGLPPLESAGYLCDEGLDRIGIAGRHPRQELSSSRGERAERDQS
jgi:hypothetical protein